MATTTCSINLCPHDYHTVIWHDICMALWHILNTQIKITESENILHRSELRKYSGSCDHNPEEDLQ